MYVLIYLVKFRCFSGHLLGNICSLGLRHVLVPDCLFGFSHLGFLKSSFFLAALFPYHCLLLPFHMLSLVVFVGLSTVISSKSEKGF